MAMRRAAVVRLSNFDALSASAVSVDVIGAVMSILLNKISGFCVPTRHPGGYQVLLMTGRICVSNIVI
ncbi:hypothetical protein GCM10017044_13660 [Kordiimonas sediminis]|uniref:Uncharacterized protein n=1 Tax=Kordiimonas sediminis TaxID=1735581 RepID=A0A919ASN6_9PROT|nr:hypothetical protein GCM10017044_13660 [Kordiimonas sediminis]